MVSGLSKSLSLVDLLLILVVTFLSWALILCMISTVEKILLAMSQPISKETWIQMLVLPCGFGLHIPSYKIRVASYPTRELGSQHKWSLSLTKPENLWALFQPLWFRQHRHVNMYCKTCCLLLKLPTTSAVLPVNSQEILSVWHIPVNITTNDEFILLIIAVTSNIFWVQLNLVSVILNMS